jgi:hypothetical protein
MTRLSFTTIVGMLLLASPLASARERKARPESERREAQPAADAAAKEAKEAKERAAKKACLTGDPVKGVELLTDLFIDTNDATYIFNQGRCYEQSNRYEDAIGRFREYLRKARNAPSAERADAEKHIADCQALIEQRRPPVPGPSGADATGTADARGGTPVSTSTTPPVTSPTDGLVAQPVAQTSSPGFGLRTAGLVTSVLGLAALGGAIALNVKYNNMVDGLKTKWDNGVESSSNDYKTMAIIGYSAGAVCVATGVLLFIVGRNAGQTMVGPAVVAGSPGATFSGAF